MHPHSHEHDPGHSHSHGYAHAKLSPRALAWAMAATLALVVAEIFGGTLGRSVALLNDAVHNLSDVPTLIISWLALRWASRPADSDRTYGYHRAGILAAFTNAILLGFVALILAYEAWERFSHPVAVVEGWMIATSLAALAVNGGITLALVRGRGDLNLRSVFVHNFGDALSNIAILIGALIIRSTGALWLDPALGLAIGALVLWSAWGILKESAHILLEGRPRGMDLENVARLILAVPGVQEVHDIHIWTLGTDVHALSCHVRIPDMHMDESERILGAVCDALSREFHISHTTIQFERAGLPRDSGYVMPEPLRSQE
ncbi:MAG TPA: cation diffusion facilitator family transporter [Candidatus Acidoferrales bacterium]|nr:cation diffusion facilitator family transporter [Candidatus Acidoferrales bacterium]